MGRRVWRGELCGEEGEGRRVVMCGEEGVGRVVWGGG